MRTITTNKATCRSFTEPDQNKSLINRFKKYWAENNAMIISGMMLLNGNGHAAYRAYKTLGR